MEKQKELTDVSDVLLSTWYRVVHNVFRLNDSFCFNVINIEMCSVMKYTICGKCESLDHILRCEVVWIHSKFT